MTQVTSLSLSKELWEKGLRIETEKVYCNIKKQWRLDTDRFDLYEIDIAMARKHNLPKDEQYPAPSTDELLAVMPYQIIAPDSYEYKLFIIKRENNYGVKYLNEQGQGILLQLNGRYAYSSETDLPEALGKMILWLLDNGYKTAGGILWEVER